MSPRKFPGTPKWMGLFGVVAAALTALPATAVEFRAGQHVAVAADEVVTDDLYATGETITIDGRVEGDIIVSGREIRLNGEATGDLMAAGQAVIVTGTVGDDIRMAGMALQLASGASVGDDVVSAGFSLETLADSAIGGSLIYTGFQSLLAGDIRESLTGSMAALEIRGGIAGDSEVEVDGDPGMPSFIQFIPSPIPLPPVPGGLTIAETARIDGQFEYTSSREARGGGAGSGAVSRVEPAVAEKPAQKAARKPSWPGKLFRWLGLVVLGLLLAWRVPGWLDAQSHQIESKPLPLAGIGLMGVAALPVGVGMLFIALVLVTMILGLLKLANLAALAMVLGLVVLGLLLLIFWLTASYLAPLWVGLCTGRWVLKRFAEDKAGGVVLPLLAGLAILALLRFVPFLGFLVAFAILLVGWGAILVWLWGRFRSAEPAPA